jgi:hypothetical protein
MMSGNTKLTRTQLKTPRAAGIAGIAFSVLTILIFWLFRSAVPADPLEPGVWLYSDSKTAVIALNLVPFAGIAFLWFVGVVRDRLDILEDRFFATVFLGSALLFLATLFFAAAILGGLVLASASAPPNELTNSTTFRFARSVAYVAINVYAIKMAAVFMISASTLVICTRIAPRWIAIAGFVCGLSLLIGSYYVSWSIVVFPLWILLISVYIVMDNLRGPRQSALVK